ncbi:MAG: class I tRNA ligase family protein [bacterium]|nr:class I tRNA ligase family protein [bacterium]
MALPVASKMDPFLEALKIIWEGYQKNFGPKSKDPSPNQKNFTPQGLLKELRAQGLVQKKTRPVPWDPKQKSPPDPEQIEYRDQRVATAFLKLPIVDFPPSLGGDEEVHQAHLIVEAHPLWALPGTVALGVHPNFSYVGAQLGESLWIFSETLLDPLRNQLNFQEDRLRIHLPGEKMIGWQVHAPIGPKKIPTKIPKRQGQGVSHHKGKPKQLFFFFDQKVLFFQKF